MYIFIRRTFYEMRIRFLTRYFDVHFHSYIKLMVSVVCSYSEQLNLYLFSDCNVHVSCKTTGA